MRTKQLTAHLYQATRRMTVEPGQWIMVVAEQAIGVYTGDDNVPLRISHNSARELVNAAFAQADTVKHASKREADEVARNHLAEESEPRRKPGRPKKKVFGRSDGQPVTTVRPIIDHIIALLNERGSIRSADLRETAGLPKDHPGYWRYRDALRWLVSQEVITATGATAARTYGKGRLFPTNGILAYAP